MSRRRNPPQEQIYRVHVKANKAYAGSNMTTQAYKFLTLDPESSSFGLASYSEMVKQYMDMYRYFRIKRISIKAIHFGNAPTTPNGAFCIAFLAPGATTAPTTAPDFETTHQVICSVDPAHTETLVLTQRDLAGIGQWCVTQQDATDDIFTSFGDVYFTSDTTALSGMITNMLIQLDMHLEFKMPLDPATISALIKKKSLEQLYSERAPKTPSQRFCPLCGDALTHSSHSCE